MPSSGRIYDALLGGKNNTAVDRDAADELERRLPGTARLARDNRDFLIRATAYLAARAGVRQFIDFGTGLPAVGAIHEIAGEFVDGVRVVYSDSDPVAVQHGRAILVDGPATLMVQANLRWPEHLLDHPRVRGLLDWTQPIAAYVVAVPHFVPDSAGPVGLLARVCARLPSGSYFVFSHVTPGTAPREDIDAGVAVYKDSGGVYVRTPDQLAAWLIDLDLDLVPPGLVPVAQWSPGLAAELDLPQLAQLSETRRLAKPVLGGLAAVGRVRGQAAQARDREFSTLVGGCDG